MPNKLTQQIEEHLEGIVDSLYFESPSSIEDSYNKGVKDAVSRFKRLMIPMFVPLVRNVNFYGRTSNWTPRTKWVGSSSPFTHDPEGLQETTYFPVMEEDKGKKARTCMKKFKKELNGEL